MSPEIIPYVILAVIVGISLGYLLLFFKHRSLKAEVVAFSEREKELTASLQSERERNAGLEANARRMPQLEADCQRLNDAARVLEADRARFSEKADRIPILEKTLEGVQRQVQQLYAENAQLKEAREADGRMIDELRNVREDFEKTFNNISKQALRDNRADFDRESLKPIRERLEAFERTIDIAYKAEASERNSLKGEIGKLVELNHQISREASNLANALKGDTKKQGNWGELILEKVLEFSGLRKDDEYRLQDSFRDGQERKIPDAVIYLPDKKNILIDAKVSLTAYERCISAPTDGERDAALLDHIASVKKHIKELAEKNYFSIPELDSPEFTLMFMPVESSFGLAVQADNELFAYAWERKIVIVSPSTLLATLRTIASIWKQERQTKNALEIADRAGKMYDKFVGFVEDMIAVGKKMDDAKTSYTSAMNKLSTGPGNLVRQSEQLRDMGAKAAKQLPLSLVDRASESLSLEPIAAGTDGRLIE